jgi:hypothetical protein
MKIFSRKLLIVFYSIIYILLNVVDFLNLLSADLDFFKKILSWMVIGYVFYHTSLTKIFIGERKKNYDIAFILIFCLFTIPKSLMLHIFNIGKTSEDFYVFNFIIDKLIIMDPIVFIQLSAIAGFILTTIICIGLSLNTEIKEKSFLGSFNMKKGWFSYFSLLIILILFANFFGFIVFDMFMQWFALAIDALILVIGLLYFLFVYIKNHMGGKLSNLLTNISNSGNDFYQRLIERFSDKKTLFLALSFV